VLSHRTRPGARRQGPSAYDRPVRRTPFPLLVAAGLVLLQAVVLVVCAVLALANLGGVAGLGVSSAIFFLVCAAALALCAWGLIQRQSWARAPIVLAELIELGLAWDARHDSAWLSIVLAVLAVVGLVSIFHPASMQALSPDQES
jgi:hypothetical protein